MEAADQQEPDDAGSSISNLATFLQPLHSTGDKSERSGPQTANDNSDNSMDGKNKNFSAVMVEEKSVIIDILATANKQRLSHPKKRVWQSLEDGDNSDLIEVVENTPAAKKQSEEQELCSSSEKKLMVSSLEELDQTVMEIPLFGEFLFVDELKESREREEKALARPGCQELWHNLRTCAHQATWNNCQVSIHPIHSPTWFYPWINQAWILGEINRQLKRRLDNEEQKAEKYAEEMEDVQANLKMEIGKKTQAICEMEELTSDLRQNNKELSLKMEELSSDLQKKNEELSLKMQQHQMLRKEEREMFEKELAELKAEKEVEQEKHAKELQEISAQVDTE